MAMRQREQVPDPGLLEELDQMTRRNFIIGASAAIIGLFGGESSAQQGEKQKYVGFVPNDFDAQKEYPLLFCLHPDGDGMQYLQALRPLQAKAQVIVAASNTYENGQKFADFLPEIKAAVDAIKKKFKVSKVYLCGLSGGGQAAYVADHEFDWVDGIIINNGSLHPRIFDKKPLGIKNAVLIAGGRDRRITPKNMEDDEAILKKNGVNTQLIRIQSLGHTFAPAATYIRAIQWLESVKPEEPTSSSKTPPPPPRTSPSPHSIR
ncbi:MAG: dienelactone hydrolase family protein [Candidatus Altiarchaeota archaeon]